MRVQAELERVPDQIGSKHKQWKNSNKHKAQPMRLESHSDYAKADLRRREYKASEWQEASNPK